MIKGINKGFVIIFYILLGAITFICILLLFMIIIIGISMVSGERYSEHLSFIILFIILLLHLLYMAHYLLFVLFVNKIVGGLHISQWLMSCACIVLAILFYFFGMQAINAIVAEMFYVLTFLSIIIPQLILLMNGIRGSKNAKYTKKMMMIAFFIPIIGSTRILYSRIKRRTSDSL